MCVCVAVVQAANATAIQLFSRRGRKPRARRLQASRFVSWWLIAACMPAAAWAAKPEITIDPGGVPPSVLEAVTLAVDSIAALADDVDGGESTRLRRRAREATITALATEGYFSPEVVLDAGTDVGGATWDITLVPGERTQIEAVDIAFAGAITGPAFEARTATLRNAWSLKQGDPFRNEIWETSKRDLLDNVTSKDFPAARFVETAADVNADRAKAHLHIKLDSGPAVKLGEVTVIGLKRVPAGTVERYVRIKPGEPYDRNRLVDYQQSLQATPFFRGAKVDVDLGSLSPKPPDEPALLPEGAAPQTTETAPEYAGPPEVTLPVRAEVVESRPRSASMALGFDDEAGARAEVVYRQNVVANKAVELESGLRVDRLRQLAYADIHLAPDENGNYDSFGVLALNSDINGLGVRRYALGAIRKKTFRPDDLSSRVEYETRLGGRLANEHTTIDGVESYSANTLTSTFEILRRDVNDKYDPREGNLVALGTGLGTELGGNNVFGRLTLRGQYWWSLSKADVITVRGEVGKLWSRDVTRVPDDFAFRTGGARTIRGYRYLGLGRKVGDAILGDSTMAVASVEGIHYFDERFGGALFFDVGNVAPKFSEMKLASAIGVGARVKTPAGPLNLDLAYALRDNNVRLHFSLGIAF